MSYFFKLIKTAFFGIKNNKTFITFIGILCLLIMPSYSILFMSEGSVAIEPYIFLIIVFCAFILPISFFGYLYKRKEYDFYNAMPVKRSQYFWGYFAAGAFIFIAALTVIFFVHMPFESVSQTWPLPLLYLKALITFFVLYCSFIFSVVFSGTIISALITFVIRNALAICVVALPLAIIDADLDAYIEFLSLPIEILTPISALFSFSDNFLMAAGQIIIAVLELISAFFMHRYRTGETTMALAFAKSRYVYQYIVMLTAALGADAFMFALSGYKFGGNGPVLTAFLTAVVIFVSFIFMNIILEKDTKSAFKRIRHFFVFTGCYGVLIIFIITIGKSIIPVSVLPFNPDFADVWVFSLKEKEKDNDNATYKTEYYYSVRDFNFSFETIEGGKSYIEEKSFKPELKEKIFTDDPQKLDLLLSLAMNPEAYEDTSLMKQGRSYIYDALERNLNGKYSPEAINSFNAVVVIFKTYYGEETVRYGYSLNGEIERLIK